MRGRRPAHAASKEGEREDEDDADADADAGAGAPEKKDGTEEEEEEGNGDHEKSGGGEDRPPAATSQDDDGDDDDDGDGGARHADQPSAVSSLSGSSSSSDDDDDDDDDDMPLSKLKEDKERRDKAKAKAKARTERAKRKAKLKAKREAAAAAETAEKRAERTEADTKEQAEDRTKDDGEEVTTTMAKEETSDNRGVQEKSKGGGDDDRDETTADAAAAAAAAAAAGDTKTGEEVVERTAGGEDEEEEDQPADGNGKTDTDDGPEKEAAAAATAATAATAAADDDEGGTATASISATVDADADIGQPPPAEAFAAIGSDAKGTAKVGRSNSPAPDVVEPRGADTGTVEPPLDASVGDAIVAEGTVEEDGTEKGRGDDPKASAGGDPASGSVDGISDMAASDGAVPDTSTSPLSQPNQSSVPPEADTTEMASLGNDSATQKPLASEAEGKGDVEMEDDGDQTNATGAYLPSAPPNGPAPMDIEEEPPIKSKFDDADRKRNLQGGNDGASPGHKRQRLESDHRPPKPPSSAEASSLAQDVANAGTTSAMPQPVQSPEAPSSHTPTADMAIDQVTAEHSPQDDSDEIRKALDPALSASNGSPNPSSQPPTPLFESRPRSTSMSPPSDPSHVRLCSPVLFTAQGHHDVAAEEDKEKEPESVEYTPGPCIETIKMNLYLEGCKAHRGNGPERQFADYWDALARNIAIGLRGKDKSKRWSNDEACNGIEYCLDSFLISKKLKRLHNELILAIMKQSLGTLVEERKFKRHIPIAWRGRARKKIGYPQKPSSMATAKRDCDVEAKQEDGAESTLEEDLKVDVADSRRLISMFARNAPVWSASGQKCAATESLATYEEKSKALRTVIPSANLPGALIVDPLVRSSVMAQNMKVSEDAIWLATTAVRDYATAVLRNTVQNKVDAREGHILATPGIAAATRTISSFELALGNCNNGPHSVRLDDQGLNARRTLAYPSGLLTSECISAERNVSGAIHVAARQRLLASKLAKGP